MEWLDLFDDFEKGIMLTFAILVIAIVIFGFALLIWIKIDDYQAREKRNDKHKD